MEIIDELEADTRTLYGFDRFIEPGGDAAFNVAIRTLILPDSSALHGGTNRATGLGSGIVADSTLPGGMARMSGKGEFVGQRGAFRPDRNHVL